MFDVGFWEMVVIFVVALVVLGPERLPKVARTLGLFIGRARATFFAVRAQVEREIHLQEIRKAGEQLENEIQQSIRPPEEPTLPRIAADTAQPEIKVPTDAGPESRP